MQMKTDKEDEFILFKMQCYFLAQIVVSQEIRD